MSFRSAGSRKPELFSSKSSIRSEVYRPLGLKSGGWVGNIGNCSSGSPMILRTILNFPGSSAMIGLVFKATGLYFLPVDRLCDVGAICEVRSRIGSVRIGESVMGGSGMSRIGVSVEMESLVIDEKVWTIVEGDMRETWETREIRDGALKRLSV